MVPNSYGLDIWGDDNFIISKDTININHQSSPSLLEITSNIRENGIKGPLLIRFPHLVKKQIDGIYSNFERAMKENDFNGSFQAVFPLKVNQFPELIKSVQDHGKAYQYGLEAGSKAELILAMSMTNLRAPITVNGFKDLEMIDMGFMAAQMGHFITLTVEGLGELESFIKVAKASPLKRPNIGIRLRLHSVGSGSWSKSGGMDAKFGLTSTEIIQAIHLLKEADLLEQFNMIHFHIGSQMEDITSLKKALREAGNIYAELKKMGATNLNSINIGGGLAVEYAQHSQDKIRKYSLEEFSNDVVYLLKEIMNAKNVEHPNIFTESGRYIVASHAVLVTPVLELFSQDYQEEHIHLKEKNPPLIEELNTLKSLLNEKNCVEYLHDALDHLESLLTLFDLGYIDLQDRSNAEILVNIIIKRSLRLIDEDYPGLHELQERLQERYLINSSIFQSLPDYWGLGQSFPVMPLSHLDQKPLRAASLWDITCDSDGEIPFKSSSPLYLHDVDLDSEEYFVAFFNVGAYQETLGMNHNLFTRPNECSVVFDESGHYTIQALKESQTVSNILEDLGYTQSEVLLKLKNLITQSDFKEEKEKLDTLLALKKYLSQNGYLRTTF